MLNFVNGASSCYIASLSKEGLGTIAIDFVIYSQNLNRFAGAKF